MTRKSETPEQYYATEIDKAMKPLNAALARHSVERKVRRLSPFQRRLLREMREGVWYGDIAEAGVAPWPEGIFTGQAQLNVSLACMIDAGVIEKKIRTYPNGTKWRVFRRLHNVKGLAAPTGGAPPTAGYGLELLESFRDVAGRRLSSTALFAVGLVEDGRPERLGQRDPSRHLICCQWIELNSGELSIPCEDESTAKIVVRSIEIVPKQIHSGLRVRRLAANREINTGAPATACTDDGRVDEVIPVNARVASPMLDHPRGDFAFLICQVAGKCAI